ncbi:MAG: hypothetical protein IKP37_07610 [Paludibacteraceae bacterium]|nr:hypothetical protein [Paludibacteraceae bacterium]
MAQRTKGTVITQILKVFATATTVIVALASESVTAQNYYGLFPSSEVGDGFRKMKTKDETNVIHWKADETVTTKTSICLRNSDSELSPYNQTIPELSNQVPIACVTPNREFKLQKPTTFRDMGLSLCDTINKLNIWLTFKPSGAPDTLFVGVRPSYRHMFTFPRPKIIYHSEKIDNNGKFTKGAAISFEAEPPLGVNSDLLQWEWYVDGEHMTGRSDRWFETYSRTKWNNGKHTIKCRYKKKNGQRFSDFGEIDIWQLSTKEKGIRAVPYWGADCTDEENIDSTNFCYNPESRWGSFTLHPLEDYVHFYMEFLNEDIQTSTITNTAKVKNFELLEASPADLDYRFFFLPTNCKGHAREPYSPVTIYFRLQGTNINYSLIPYIRPTVKIAPDSVEICENSFESASESSIFTATASGFPNNNYRCQWYYSKTKNGQYEPVEKGDNATYIPDHTGYYKVVATDGVFSTTSEPVKVKQRMSDCLSAEIYTKDKRDYTCINGTLELNVSLTNSVYTYQWYIGPTNGKDLRAIVGATGPIFYGSANKPNESYFVEVKYGSRHVISNPFHIRQLAKLQAGTSSLITEASPTEVCQDYNTTLKTRINSKRKDTLPVIYRFYRASYNNPILLGEIESRDENVYLSTPVNSNGSKYYVVAVGCDQQLRSKENVTINIRNDESCGRGHFYVKKTGDDYRDGTSWKNAFATMKNAIETIKSLRKSQLYANTPMAIHIAAGVYQPYDKDGFDLPDNVTIYGGYDELPTDRSISGTHRNPISPANPNGFATTFRSDSSSQRIIRLEDKANIKIVGIHFDGEKYATSIDGRAIYSDNTILTIDSCWFTNFRISQATRGPLAAVCVLHTEKCKRMDIKPEINVLHSTFSKNAGYEWGGCLNIMTDAEVNIKNSTFNHNTNRYKGGTALLTYNASPNVTIMNSTFYSNQIVGEGGSYGSSVIRMAGGEPICNIYASTICDHFYKENGKLNIYHSIVECAGNADIYRNNFPKKSPFVAEEKDNAYNPRKFGANFKGGSFNKINSVDNCITQVLIPSNKLSIVGQAGAPNAKCLYDQRGIKRNIIASTYGAYEEEYSVAIDYSKKEECTNGETHASLTSAVSGLTDFTYQWVNNYSDMPDQKGPNLTNVGLGTYWLDIKGKDRHGKEITISSNEIRVSDICEVPGEFFVNAHDGNDSFAGTTWSKALATLDRALQIAREFREKNANRAVTINLTAGTYTPSSSSGFKVKDLTDVVIRGGFPESASRDDKSEPKMFQQGEGYETIFKPKDVKGRVFDLGNKVKNLRIVGIHLKGVKNQISSGGAFNINGAEVSIDSCWITGFNDASVIQDGNNSCIAIGATSKVSICNSFFAGNLGKQSGVIGITGNGNTTELNVYNSTFHANWSSKSGGAVLYVNNAASPAIKMMNVTCFSNRTSNAEMSACSNIRLIGKETTSLQMYNCSMFGTYLVESGKLELFNSLVEATGENVVLNNSFVSYPHLKKTTDDMDLYSHRKFADSFKYTLSFDCGFLPVLEIKKGGNEEICKKVPTLEKTGDFDLSKDECGKPREAESCMGATQYNEE